MQFISMTETFRNNILQNDYPALAMFFVSIILLVDY